MIIHLGKLTTHLCGHEGMGDVVGFEIIVQGNQVEADFLGNDIDRSSRCQGGIHIHHTGIEAVAGVCRHVVFCLQVVVTAVPVAESHQIPMLQHTALRNTRRAGSIEKYEETVRRNRNHRSTLSIRKMLNVLCQQDFALIRLYDRAQCLVGNQQLGIGILHHEVQTFLRIGGVQRLIGTAGLQHSQRGYGHPLTAWYQNGDDILRS